MPVALYLVEALTVVSAVAFLMAGTTVVVFAEYFLRLSLLIFWAVYPAVLMIMNGVEYICMFGINILIGTVREIVGR